MNAARRQRLLLALLVSLLLHLLVLGAPAGYLPFLAEGGIAEAPVAVRLDAHLARLPDAAPAISLSVGASSVPQTGLAEAAEAAARPGQPPPVAAPPAGEVPREGGQESGVPAVAVAAVTGGTEVAGVAGVAGNAAGARDDVLAEPSASGAQEAAAAAQEGVPVVAASHFSLPRRGSVRFRVMRGEHGLVVGQSVHHWNHDGQNYVLNSVTETTGLIALFKPVRAIWLSQGAIGAQGLQPHEFRTEKNGVRGDAAGFDWQSMTLSLSGGSQRTVRLMPGSQDVLSMFYQLGTMLPALQQHVQAVEQDGFRLYVTTGRKLEEYHFQWLGEESRTLKRLGEQPAVHLRVLAGEQTIDLWLGENLRGLPLQIRYTDGKGDSFDQVADEIEFEEEKGL